MLVGRCQKITDNGSARKAKKRPHSILILTGGRADLALQPPQSANRAFAARFEGPADLFQLGNIVPGAFTPVLAKHTKHLSLVDILSVGVGRLQKKIETMRKQGEEFEGT